MSDRPQNVAVLGSTGSIGTSTLDVIAASGGRLQAVALSARSSLAEAVEQARRFRPRWLVACDAAKAADFDFSSLPAETELLVGPDALQQVAADPEVETVVSAVVGSAGLLGTWAAVAAGKRVALANKESLVVAGPLIQRLAAETGAKILPVDSEHSAVFQALAAGRAGDVRRIVLTASGGPFRQHTLAELEHVTVEEALAHPTWDMGPKITIDSATMMNKALEIIEAHWLFGLGSDQIGVIIHPQSVIHSFVEFTDHSVLAQLGPPDMRTPIQYALTYPERADGCSRAMDWAALSRLDFEQPEDRKSVV